MVSRSNRASFSGSSRESESAPVPRGARHLRHAQRERADCWSGSIPIMAEHSRQTYFPVPQARAEALLATDPEAQRFAAMSSEEITAYLDSYDRWIAEQPWYQDLLARGGGNVPLGSRWD